MRLSLISLAVLTPCVAGYASAEEQIETITVTASRSATANIDQALSVSGVSSDTIKQDNPQHISESLTSVSGVLLNQLAGGQGHNAAIRMPINYGGYTLYLQDNVPLQSPAFYNHNALWWASSNADLGRIEVIKGAGTSLHGSGAVAATINVLSSDLSQEQTQVGLTLGGNGYQRVKLATTVKDKFGVSFAALNNKGWREHAEVEKYELNAKQRYNFDKHMQLTTHFIASRLDQQLNNTLTIEQYLDSPTQSALPPEIQAIDPRRQTDYARLSGELTYAGSDVEYSIIPFLRYRTNDYIATWQPNMPKIESTVKSAGMLSMIRKDFSDEHHSAVGVDVEYSQGTSLSYQTKTITTEGWNALTYPEGHVFYDNEVIYTNIAPYFQHNYQVTDALLIQAGMRFDNNHYQLNNHLSEFADDGFGNRSLADRSDTIRHWSPKLSANYRLSDDASTYLRFANAIRIPTASELYQLKTKDSSAQVGHLSQETSDTYELGYKHNFAKASFEAAIYRMDVSDAIVTAYDDYGASYRVNAAKVRHQGLELSFTYPVTQEWSIALASSLSRHTYKNYTQDAGRLDPKTGASKAVSLNDNSLPLAPSYLANIRLMYQPKRLKGLTAQVEFKSVGDYYGDELNKQRFDGYTIANLKVNYDVSEKLSINARISNLMDKAYLIQNEVRYGKTQVQPGDPQTVFVALNYRL